MITVCGIWFIRLKFCAINPVTTEFFNILPNFITSVVLLITFICCHQQLINSSLLLLLLSLKYYKIPNDWVMEGSRDSEIRKPQPPNSFLGFMISCQESVDSVPWEFPQTSHIGQYGTHSGCRDLILQPMLVAKTPFLGLYPHASISKGLTPFSTPTPPAPLSHSLMAACQDIFLDLGHY